MTDPDITIYNATAAYPVVVGHTPAGRALLAGNYGRDTEGLEWICIDRASIGGSRKFRDLHEQAGAACLRVRHDQASRGRLDELTCGRYSTFTSNPRVA